MSQQWLRNVSLIVGDAAGNGLDLSQMHIRFMVRNATVETLKRADITVYNLTDAHAKLIQGEFTRVQLQVGYGDGLGMIFQGEIAVIRRGKETAADTFVYMLGQDADRAVNWSVTNCTLAAGWDQDAVQKRLLQDLGAFGVNPGSIVPYKSNPAPRGKVMFGMTRDYQRLVAHGQLADWSIEDYQLNVLAHTGVLPGEAVVLNSRSGMIGVPEQTIQGLMVRSLMNPQIRAGGKIQINNADVVSMKLYPYLNGPTFVPSLDADGFYRSACVTHVGDTRGNDWYTEAICIAVDGTAPASGPTLTAVPDGQ